MGHGETGDDLPAVAPPETVVNSPLWEQTLNKIIPAVVSIRLIAVRDFGNTKSFLAVPLSHSSLSSPVSSQSQSQSRCRDREQHTESQRNSQATGFIVDKQRGIILSNRHVVQPGPTIADAVLNKSKEEVKLTPIYRDPVHDFGFYRFNPADIKYMKIEEISLAPELARVGLEIRVIGNDSGERLSILSGTLARLDRMAPKYGMGKYNDWNTFYYQAASMTSGGSSGSPVVDIDGNAIALNAGGMTNSASSYFLPLDRVVRALKLIQEGMPVQRGDIQTVFSFLAFDEVKRLGLDAEYEQQIRQGFPNTTGMLSVSTVIPNGPAHNLLHEGDILLKVNGEFIVAYTRLEDIFDSSVDQPIEIMVQRGTKILEMMVTVQDLHSITPSRFLEVGGGILHELSYQMARSYIVPIQGVFVAGAGYMFSLSGISKRCVITNMNKQPTPTIDDFIRVFSTLRNNERVPVRYYDLSDVNKDKSTIILVDRRWHGFRMATRDDATGLWTFTNLAPCIGEAIHTPHSASHVTFDDSLGPAKIITPSLVSVASYTPFQIDGVLTQTHVGIGVVLDAERGLLLVDRQSIPTTLCDILLTFANSIMMPGELLYLHPTFNFGIVKYDVSLLGETLVRSIDISPKELSQGDSVHMVCMNRSSQIMVRKTVVTNVRQIFVNEATVPAYRAMNTEAIELENPMSYGGVLTTEAGEVQGFYASFTKHGSKSAEFHIGMVMRPIVHVLNQIRSNQDIGAVKSLEVELAYTHVAHARVMGLTDEWVKKIEGSQLSRRNVLLLRRVTSGTAAAQILKAGDLILAINDKPVTRYSDITDICDQDDIKMTILRDGVEMDVLVPLSAMSTVGTERIVGWAGAVFHMPHKAVYQHFKDVPPGVLCAAVSLGSPSLLYGLSPLSFITEINGVTINDLDGFLNAVAKVSPDTFVRVRTMMPLTRKVRVIAIRPNTHYFSTWQIQRNPESPLGWKLESIA
eukprot:jgi/Hompol1/351/HPOL_002476-RA